MYKIEAHFHTAETSGCATVPGAEGIRLCAEKRYSAVVVTDHYFGGFFKKSDTWAESANRFLAGYKSAKLAGELLGVHVLLGMELRFEGHFDDYLVYGADERFLYDNPLLCYMNQHEFFRLANESGLLLFQAHPFRHGADNRCPEALHGIEVFNGNIRHNSRNDLALALAREHELLEIAGSDFHVPEDVGIAAVLSERLPRDSQEFADILRSKKYTLETP